jgi:Glucosamine 6-phosphate synthetase, contains amidotransferase and phosphosugar isomerase domains
MCGIAGYSFSLESTVDRTVAARALLAGIAERGADSAGFAYRGDDSKVTVHKQRTGASEFLHRIDIPQDAAQLLVHVRDYTKGHPRVLANNHPIRHGAVVGIHNGTIAN